MDQFQQRPFKLGEGRGGAFDGGVITVRDAALIPFGGYSTMNNVKKWHPGIQKRRGMTLLHSVANDKMLTLYQFSKGERDEIHTFAQNDDGDVIEFTNNPPAVTVGALGSAVFSTAGTAADQVPASWGDIRDYMLFANGIDQHQIFPGNDHKISSLNVVFNDPDTHNIPEESQDWTEEVLEEDGEFTDISFSIAGINGLYIMTQVPANKLSFIIEDSDNSDISSVYYVNNLGAWAAVSGFTDGTISGGDSLAQSGDMTWTHPTDEAPHYLFGQSGYWYKIVPADEYDGLEIEQILYSGDWRPMQNVWDGILIDIVEAQFYDASAGVYSTYPASAITISDMTISDKLTLACADEAYGFYLDVANTPNSTAVTMVVKRWNGSFFTTISSVDDQTAGLTKSGFVTWPKDKVSTKSQFNGQQFHQNWYEITFTGGTLSDNVIVSALYLPVTSMKEFGAAGVANCVWKERGCYVSSIFDRDIYVSAKNRLNVLNGTDYAILEPGDGRRNRTVCVKKFHNEIIAWQTEKGRDGGCTTLFEGYSPSTFGKLVLSSQVGTFNAKTAIVIDGATTTTKNDDKFQTMAFWISHYGIFMTDGRLVTMISGDIQNYFDSDFDECIRLGYENEMWVEHDIDRGVLRFGLVSGPTATEPNVFPIFDLEDNTWSFDTFAEEDYHLSCALQCEANSDQFPIIHIGAGLNNFVYLLNEGLNDDGEAIDFHLVLELSHVGFCLDLREANLRMRVEDTGGIVKNIYENSRLITNETETLSFLEVQTGDALRRHRVFERIYEETQISLELRENTVDQDVYLYDLNLDVGAVLNK